MIIGDKSSEKVKLVRKPEESREEYLLRMMQVCEEKLTQLDAEYLASDTVSCLLYNRRKRVRMGGMIIHVISQRSR